MAAAVGVLAVVGFVVFVLPQIKGLSGTIDRLRSGDPWWLALGLALEAASLAGYILLFRTVFSCHGVRINWKSSYQINMAGVVASKLLAAAGAGGVALTVWALRASGLELRSIARRMLSFELLLYAQFTAALVVGGVGLRTGVLSGHAPWTLTVAPAALAGIVIALAVSMRLLPADLERRVESLARSTRPGRWLGRLASAPAALRDATAIVGELVADRRVGLVGATAYWGFDIATLWACFHAFGHPPPAAVIVMAYFIGALGNALPLPGGVGGVEGGTIGAFVAFGTPVSLAVLAVLSYRAISFWLPTLPGSIAYLQLRRTVARWRASRTEAKPS